MTMPRKMTREEFIEKATLLHKGKFNYDDVVYVDRDTKVRIYCPKHGYFEQAPREHLTPNKEGCPKCAKEKSVKPRTGNLEMFIKRAAKKHNNKYDYSKFEYKTAKTNGIIICPKHGEFMQTPDRHLRGCGCPRCKGELRKKCMNMTKESFIHDSYDKYGDMFDLSNINFVDHKTPVEIYCKKHKKTFFIAPNLFLRGQNCPDCGRDRQAETFQKTLDDFLAKAKMVHGDKYDYIMVHYEKTNKKVPIICHEKDKKTGKEHGIFMQKPSDHLSGMGCWKCNGNNPLSDEEFAECGTEIHHGRYTYKHAHYVNSHTPLLITCPIHGDFPQMPYKHIKEGQGCPACSQSKLELCIYDMLKENNIEFVREKQFKDFGSYKYDFFVECKKLLIECQGEQHFGPDPHFDRKNNFEYRLANDIKKYKYAINNGYLIIYLLPKRSVCYDSQMFGGMYDTERIFFTSDEILKYIQKL